MQKDTGFSEEYWKKRLTPEQYRSLREGGTERAFGGKYVTHHQRGVYCCAACKVALFSSTTKYDSGSGWPSFWEVMSQEHIEIVSDESHDMFRLEVRCKNCGSHLGHVFDDGPNPSGKRYCINSICLDFVE